MSFPQRRHAGENAEHFSVWSKPQFEALLREDHSSVFLNLHHTAAAWTLESVRLSKLLCSRALVLSQSSYPRDEAEFSGMVDFVDWSDIPSEFARLLSMTQRDETNWLRNVSPASPKV